MDADVADVDVDVDLDLVQLDQEQRLGRGRAVEMGSAAGCRRAARGAARRGARDITRGARKSRVLGQGGTAEPGSAEPGIHDLRTLVCLQQGNDLHGGYRSPP